MQCPSCSSPKTIKNGHTRGKQRYKCKHCGHQFVEDAQPVGAPSSGTAPPCPYCDRGILHKRSSWGQRLYYQCRNPECKRFSTYELDSSGDLVRVVTRKEIAQSVSGCNPDEDDTFRISTIYDLSASEHDGLESPYI
jgi:late competence protein required for DNA uptake (superfamily II DNA/RNA helicase)